jgi:hypothetical protein
MVTIEDIEERRSVALRRVLGAPGGKMNVKKIIEKHLGPAQMQDAIDRLAKLIKNGELLAATDPTTFLNLVADAIEDERSRRKQAYEALLGDTDASPWHSDHCYHKSGAHRDPNLCTCGLTKALRLLQNKEKTDV